MFLNQKNSILSCIYRLRTELVLLSALVILEIGFCSLLVSHQAFIRFKGCKDLSMVYPKITETSPQEIKHLCGGTVQKTLTHVMNFVSNDNQTIIPSNDKVIEFYKTAEQGGVLNCNGMAELFLHALHLQKIPARKVFINTNFGDFYSSHTLIEVLQDGKWVIFDPTFHVSFLYKQTLLGVQEMVELIKSGNYTEIKPLFYGQVRYPIRLETYPIHWLSLYNNILIFDAQNWSSHSKLYKLTFGFFLRYWIGPCMFYYAPSGLNSYLDLLNTLYLCATCLIPLFVGFLFFLFLIKLVFFKRRFN